MKKTEKGLITYERSKNGLKISGEARHVKPIIWRDQLSRIFLILLVAILILKLPNSIRLPLLLEWLKNNFPSFNIAHFR